MDRSCRCGNTPYIEDPVLITGSSTTSWELIFEQARPELRQESPQKSIDDETEDQVTAEFAVMLEGKAREPNGPGGPAFGSLGGFGLVHHAQRHKRFLISKENDQHGRGEIARHKNQICDHKVDHHDGKLIHATRKGFTGADRESTDASGFGVVVFLNMVGEVDAGNA